MDRDQRVAETVEAVHPGIIVAFREMSTLRNSNVDISPDHGIDRGHQRLSLQHEHVEDEGVEEGAEAAQRRGQGPQPRHRVVSAEPPAVLRRDVGSCITAS